MLRSFLFLIVLLPAAFAFAAGGQFLIVKGDVKLTSGGLTAPAKVGSKVQVGDTVETAADSRAKIVMSDRNVIYVSPLTRFKIEEYADGKSRHVKLGLLSGKLRNNVLQKYNSDVNKFEVHTPTAVAGVRGTQFITSYDQKKWLTEVVTLVGQVELRSLNAAAGAVRAVLVRQGERSQVDPSAEAPRAPEKIPKSTLDEINKDTNVRRDSATQEPALQTDVGSIVKNPREIKNTLIENAVEKKYDKTKVNVVPRPPSP